MKIDIRLVSGAIAALFLAQGLGACSSGPKTTGEEDLAEQQVGEQATDEQAQGQIPQFQELVFMEEDPTVVDLGQSGDISAFRVGNIKVLHLPTPTNEVVAARLYFRGGSANLDEELAGIEQLSLNVAVNGGTASTPKEEFKERLNSMGSSIAAVADRDFSAISLNSVVDYFDATWELFEEALFEPTFPDSEIELRRAQQLASIDSLGDDPDRLVNEVARDLTYAGHPYYFRQLGTRENVERFTDDDLKAWQRWLIVPERLLLVVVGNIERGELIDKVSAKLGRLPSSDIELPEVSDISHEFADLRVEEMELPTNYILGYFGAPDMGHVDYPAMLLATRHLRDRLFEEVRTKRNLTYAVSAGLGNRDANVGFLYVTAVNPSETMPVIFAEVQKLKDSLISEQELEEVRNVFLTSHYMGLETNANIAAQLARAELIGGDWTISPRFQDAIMEVTPEDLQRVAQTYINHIQFGAVGDPQALPPELFGVESEEVEIVDEVEES